MIFGLQSAAWNCKYLIMAQILPQDLVAGVEYDRSNKIQKPLYAQLARQLADLIEREFAVGDRFYTDRELMRLFKVSQPTVRRAVEELVQQGLLSRRIGSGTHVMNKRVGRFLGLFLPAPVSRVRVLTVESYAMLCERFDYSLSIHYVRKGHSIPDLVKLLRRSPSEERLVFQGLTLEMAPALYQATKQLGYHSVLVNPPPPGYEGSSVCFDNASGIELAIDHLISLGHERIVLMVNEPIELLEVQVRLECFQRLIVERKLLRARVVDCALPNWGDSYQAAYAKMEEIMAMRPVPTALFCISGVGAWAALRYCVERGIKVPAELSVIGVDNLIGSDLLAPPLTTLSYERGALALPTAELLWSEDPTPRHVIVKPELIARQSTGRAP